jgi:hypothetical protein
MTDRKEERRAFDIAPDDEDDEGMDLENLVAGSLDGMMDDPERYPRVEDSPTGFLQVDIDKEDAGDGSQPGDEADEDLLTVGTDPDLVMDQIDDFTDDPEVLEDFADRQRLADDSDHLLERLREHTDKSPILSSSDVDADWERADQVGEEAAGGSVATPDQDIVEELGEALGINYRDDEPLSTEDKLLSRDENRWELDPESAEDDLDEDDLENDIEALDKVGLLDDEDLDEMNENNIRGMVDELDDNILDDDYLEDEDELDEMDDDFLVGGLDDDDEDY